MFPRENPICDYCDHFFIGRGSQVASKSVLCFAYFLFFSILFPEFLSAIYVGLHQKKRTSPFFMYV